MASRTSVAYRPQSFAVYDDSASIDAFARVRMSEPFTLFDSKQIFDNQPLFWDDAETSGSGTSTAHSAYEAASTISVSAETAGKRTRQTFRRFNYQPGKSQLLMVTFSEFDTATGIAKRVGYFDDSNGIFFQSSEGTLQVAMRTNVSQTATDTVVSQSSWSIDKLDGKGVTGKTLDASKSNIGIIDFEWLGVGRVRMGFVIDGMICYCHEFLNANNLPVVYMSTPNLPVRYEIENDGNGAGDGFACICSTVISEGGTQKTGVLRSRSTANVQVDANAADALYAVIGLRLKTAYIGATVELERLSMLAEGKDAFEWSILWNPTVAGTFTYGDETNSAVQTASGATGNTVTGGYLLDSGYVSDSSSVTTSLTNALILGSKIDGTRDEIVVCVRPISTGADIQATLTWRELL